MMNLKHDKVMLSIIIVIYKSENYIEECIESVISQTDRNFEVILVNNGSNDKLASIPFRP